MKNVSGLTSALLATWVLLSGCAPRLSLPQALPRSAPIELRRAQYERYRAARTEITVSRIPGFCGRTGCTPPSETVSSQARLANGIVVMDPADLLPLVSRDSRTWTHAQTARTLETAGVISWVSVVPLAAVGAGLLFGGGRLGWDMNTTLWVSIPILVVGGLAALTGATLHGTAGFERRDAFRTFDDDFRDRLDLCVGPMEIGECSSQSRRIHNVWNRGPRSGVRVDGLSLRF